MNAVNRTLKVLSLIAENNKTMTLSQVSEELALPLATAHRLLKTLEQEKFISRDPVTLEYSPGKKIFRIASLTRRHSLSGAADPIIKSLSHRFNETVLISQLLEHRVICIAMAESRRALHLSVSVGQPMPLHASSSARVLFSDWTNTEIDELFAKFTFTQLTKDTPDSVNKVLEHVDHIRNYGYDESENEFDLGVWSASAPIWDAQSKILASLTLTAPRERSHQSEIRMEIIDAVLEAAHDITLMIGGKAPERKDESTLQ
ncbi:MAG: IclR family transcriptional regulator [Microbacteriaceae bacterium]